MNEAPINYYQNAAADSQGMFYRLDGADVVDLVIDKIKGGFVVVNGVKKYNSNKRMMNDHGVSRVEFFLSSTVSKISHLTKFSNEARVMIQIKELSRSFLIELVKNMKFWAPEAELIEYTENKIIDLPNGRTIEREVTVRYFINPNYDKVRNPELVVQVVENAMLLSYQRGEGGFEAINLGKSWQVTENIGRENEAREEGRLKRLFGGRING